MQASLPQHSELLGSHWRELKKMLKKKENQKTPPPHFKIIQEAEIASLRNVTLYVPTQTRSKDSAAQLLHHWGLVRL